MWNRSIRCLRRFESPRRIDMRSSRRHGITLVEVVASIGLLATLLVTTLSTRSSLIRQANKAFAIEQATEAIDQQIAVWFENSDELPRNESGAFADTEQFFWRTSVVPARSSNSDWDFVTLRVDAVSSDTQDVVASVEIVDLPADSNPANGAGP